MIDIRSTVLVVSRIASRNYYHVLWEGLLGCRQSHSFLHSRYFALLFFRVNESNHRDAAEQTDLPMLTRSASESFKMRRRNSSGSNRVVSMADFTQSGHHSENRDQCESTNARVLIAPLSSDSYEQAYSE